MNNAVQKTPGAFFREVRYAELRKASDATGYSV